MDIRSATESLSRHKKKTAAATGGAVILGGIPVVLVKFMLSLQSDIIKIQADNLYLREQLDTTRKQAEVDRSRMWKYGSALEYNVNILRNKAGFSTPMEKPNWDH